MMAAGTLSDAVGIDGREGHNAGDDDLSAGSECQMPPPIDSLLSLKANESESSHFKQNTHQNVKLCIERPGGIRRKVGQRSLRSIGATSPSVRNETVVRHGFV